MKTSRFKFFRLFADGYIWLFRGTPVLLQMIFVFNALPQVGLRFSPFTSAAIALSMNESAYMSEIIRAGLESVGKGQREAARAVGLTEWKAMRFVVIPQALRVIIPPTANQFIGMLKLSALASVIAVRDLLLTAQRWASVNFDYTATLVSAAIYYLAFTTIFTIFQKRIEKSFSARRKAVDTIKLERVSDRV
jgi:polar amino acid transport system permease protein